MEIQRNKRAANFVVVVALALFFFSSNKESQNVCSYPDSLLPSDVHVLNISDQTCIEQQQENHSSTSYMHRHMPFHVNF